MPKRVSVKTTQLPIEISRTSLIWKLEIYKKKVHKLEYVVNLHYYKEITWEEFHKNDNLTNKKTA